MLTDDTLQMGQQRMREVSPLDQSHYHVERRLSAEVEALQLWAIAVGLALFAGAIYVTGLIFISA